MFQNVAFQRETKIIFGSSFAINSLVIVIHRCLFYSNVKSAASQFLFNATYLFKVCDTYIVYVSYKTVITAPENITWQQKLNEKPRKMTTTKITRNKCGRNKCWGHESSRRQTSNADGSGVTRQSHCANHITQ